MSIEIIKPDIKFGKFTIPGGWKCKVPEMNLIPEDESAYVSYWARKGMRQREARQKVKDDMQVIFGTRYGQLIRQFVVLSAKDYMKRWPHLGLEGFDPELLSKVYVPGRVRDFLPNLLARKTLVSMAEEVEGG